VLQLEVRLTSQMKCAYFADEGLSEQANIKMSKFFKNEKNALLHHEAPVCINSVSVCGIALSVS
jgi:hypothetical protein